MDTFFLLKTVHVVGAAVLFGTGIGIAFFMLMAHRTRDPGIIADIVFTASAVILQPLTGALLISIAGYDFSSAWISVSLALYVLTGVCWLPVVWIQYRIRNLARAAANSGSSLPAEYSRLFQMWFVLGFPAFAAVLGIFWLMVTKPATIF